MVLSHGDMGVPSKEFGYGMIVKTIYPNEISAHSLTHLWTSWRGSRTEKKMAAHGKRTVHLKGVSRSIGFSISRENSIMARLSPLTGIWTFLRIVSIWKSGSRQSKVSNYHYESQVCYTGSMNKLLEAMRKKGYKNWILLTLGFGNCYDNFQLLKEVFEWCP